MSYKKEKKIDFPPDYAILTQTYNGPASHIKVRHKLCDNVFRIRIRNLIKDNFECPYCSGQVNKNNRWFRNKVKALYNDDITVLGDFINEETKVLIEYKLCGHQTLVAPKKLIDYTQSKILKKCPQCGPIKQGISLAVRMIMYALKSFLCYEPKIHRLHPTFHPVDCRGIKGTEQSACIQ